MRGSAVFPLMPAQFVNNAGLWRGESSGEVYCPRKWSHIAVMRCGEYQDRDGCGSTCAAKPAEEDLARARAQVVQRDESESGPGGKGTLTCRYCGGAKRLLRSTACRDCRYVSHVEHARRRREQ
jgi:hypothetical protein